MIWNGKDVSEYVEMPPDIDVEPNGVELGINEIYEISQDASVLIDGDDRLIRPGKYDISHELSFVDDGVEYYMMSRGMYELRLANRVNIPSGVVGLVFPRSTLNRFGVCMHQTAIWDSGYDGRGTLTVDVHIHDLKIRSDEKWFQLMFLDADEADELYDGHWNGEGIDE